jgi:hypothetical protein
MQTKNIEMTKAAAGVILTIVTLWCTASRADNPIVQTIFTADPAPVVHDGVCYLYTSHDEEVLVKNFFTMKDWRCFSSTDMVNWTDHGAVATLRNFAWADPKISGWGGFENGAWAVQCIERNGKWYLYCPLQGRGIGVLVADNPFGPFTDPIGKPLIGGKYDSIDPTVFIDDNGQAYLYWGNPRCWYVKLNKDMISYDTRIGDNGLVVLDMTIDAFGKRSKEDPKRATTYEEGPWLYKRSGLYYLFFAAGPISEHLGYSTSSSAEGPWKYGGVVMPTQGRSFTDHPGVVDYKGKTYLFYHNGALPGGGGFHRSVCVDELKFKPDGSVVQMDMTKEGAVQIGHLNPYAIVQAETICWSQGIKSEPSSQGGMCVYAISTNAYIKVKAVDFRKGATSFAASVASTIEGGIIELHLDSATGPQVGNCPVPNTGGMQKWKTLSFPVKNASGVHDLYLVFNSSENHAFNVDWWKFE